MRVWIIFPFLLGVLIEIPDLCFQEGICPQKDPPSGVLVLTPGTEVTLHCSGRISVNGMDIAQAGGVSAGRAGAGDGQGAEREGVRAGLDAGQEAVPLNRSGVMEGLEAAGGARGTLDLTGEDRGGANGSEVWRAAEHANAGATLGTEGPADGAQWRVNGRMGTRGGEVGDVLHLAPLRLTDGGNHSCHRGGREVFSVEIVVAAPLEQPTLSCYRKTPTSRIRCNWTANQPVTPTPQCYLILKKGLYGQPSKVNCSFVPSRDRCWCTMEPRAGEKDAFQATLCLTSITGSVTSPTIQFHPEEIIKPDPPTNLTVQVQDGMEHKLKVTWKYPSSWSSNYYHLKFQLEYKPIVNGEEKKPQTVIAWRVSHTIYDILPWTLYQLRVRGREEFGHGQWSDWSPRVYSLSWTDPEPSGTSEVHSSSGPFDPFPTGSGEGSGSELLPVSSLPCPTLTFHLSWVLGVCMLVTLIVLAVYILRHREQFVSKLLKLAQSSASHTPAPPPYQLPREEGNPLMSPGPSAPAFLQEEERGEGIHLTNMGYFLVQTN